MGSPRGAAVGDARAEREDVTHFAAELLPAGASALPDGRRHAGGFRARHARRRRPLRLRSSDAPRVARHGVHIDRSREGHARPDGISDVPLDATCACATCKGSAARTCTTSSSAASRWDRGSCRCTTSTTTTRLMAEARDAIERGTYADYAQTKLGAIDRHEHTDRRSGGIVIEQLADVTPPCEVVVTRTGGTRHARPHDRRADAPRRGTDRGSRGPVRADRRAWKSGYAGRAPRSLSCCST